MDSKDHKIVSTQNTLLSVLIVINIMLVLIAFYLFMRDDEPSSAVSNENMSTGHVNEIASRKQTSDLSDSTTPIVTDSEDHQNQANRISQSLETISKSLENMGELSSQDATYVNALEELRKEVSSQINIKKPTINDVTTKQAKQVRTTQSIDYFNKIDVSKLTTQATSTDKQRLTAQIAQLVAQSENTDNQPDTEQTNGNYLQTLKTASKERTNEMRTIEVIKGDTLWDIAERAYGNGHEYPKIFKANPNITDPDRIEIGMLLLVPL
jgi:hypothetical protein